MIHLILQRFMMRRWNLENQPVAKTKTRRKRRYRRRRVDTPGEMPGRIQAPPEAQPTVIHVTSYGQGDSHWRTINDIQALEALIAKQPRCWIEVSGLANDQLIIALGKRFALHPLALEDVMNLHQSPKIDVYNDMLFIVCRLITSAASCETEQVSLFVANNVLISFHERDSKFTALIRERIANKRGRLHQTGVDFLAYAILDALIDTNFLIADTLADRIEELDDEVTDNLSDQTIHSIRMLRHDLLIVRRTVWPMRDVINQLIRDDHQVIREETKTFLKDVYDHAVQLIDLIEVYREMCADLRDFYLSAINLRSNEIMKVLTIISTIFIPLGFIAGVYGMNFNTESAWNMPELSYRYGYLWVLAVMGMITGGMLFYFRKQKWI